jgi:hypothetical protein
LMRARLWASDITRQRSRTTKRERGRIPSHRRALAPCCRMPCQMTRS